VEDIEQQAGDVGDAVAVFPQVSVPLGGGAGAPQQRQQDGERHLHEAQHALGHGAGRQRLLQPDRGDRKSGAASVECPVALWVL